MKFKDLQIQVESDLTLEEHNLREKLYTIPVLHSRYLRLYTESKKKLDDLMLDMDKIYRSKWHLYSTEGVDGYKLKTQKEITIYVEGNNEVIKKRIEINRAKRVAEYLREVVDNISKMSFNIKNLLAHLEWMNGGLK